MKKERGFVKAKLILRGGCFFTHPRYTSIKKYLGINRVKFALIIPKLGNKIKPFFIRAVLISFQVYHPKLNSYLDRKLT